MLSLIAVIDILLILGTCCITIENAEISDLLGECETAIEKVAREDRETIVETASALYTTWLSQGCEVQTGPQYVIRKYTFFENNMFLLLRFYYAEASCSIPTHTISIRGMIHLQGSSSVVSGAIETKFRVDTVHITPLNDQITYKLETKFNQTCGPRPKWKLYNAELIYEQPRKRSPSSRYNPIHNSLQVPSPSNVRLGMNCLKSFGIEFDELKLLRLERRPTFTLFDDTSEYLRPQLLLANPVSHVYSRCCYKPTSLQPAAMVRADIASTTYCPLCRLIVQSTKNTPPVLHQAVTLPTMIGGFWHSERCESSTGGIWLKRQFQMHLGDKLWTGRWDYYNNSQCKDSMYTITAAGNYVQRVAGQESYRKMLKREIFLDYGGAWNDVTRGKVKRQERSVTDGVNQYLQNMQSSMGDKSRRMEAMLRNRWTSSDEATTEILSTLKDLPSGISELDLHVVESALIPENASMFGYCNSDKPFGVPPNVWEEYCVPRSIEVPSILRLRAKITANWNGHLILLLGGRDDHVWQAPLRQCGYTPPRNPKLQMHLYKSFTLRLGLVSSTATTINQFLPIWFSLQFVTILSILCIYLAR